MTLALRPLATALVTGGIILGLSACTGAKESVRDDEGTITEANEDASVFDMKVGDCYLDPSNLSSAEATTLETIPAVPCDEDHDFEVYATSTLDDGSGYPGTAEVESQADQFCYDEFEGFVGTAYDDSELDFTYMYPTDETWAMDDREITCMVAAPEQVTGTLKASKR